MSTNSAQDASDVVAEIGAQSGNSSASNLGNTGVPHHFMCAPGRDSVSVEHEMDSPTAASVDPIESYLGSALGPSVMSAATGGSGVDASGSSVVPPAS
jgi:hypothetical protein